MRVMIVGAAGAMASVAVRDLLESVDDVSITAADLRPVLLNDPRLRLVSLNVQNEESAARTFDQHDVVLNCAPYRLNVPVMRAALRARVPYIDLGGLYHVTLDQLALHEDFVQAELTAVLGMGSTPGITNVMAGALASQMDRVEEVHVRVACQDETLAGPLPIPYSLETILDEFSLDPIVFRNGQAVTVPPLSGSEVLEFPPPVGTAEAVYTLHSEVAMFPHSFPELREASFKIAFPTEFGQSLRLLVELGFASRDPIVRGVSSREMLLALAGKQRVPESEPRDCDILMVEVKGRAQGKSTSSMAQSIILPHPSWRIAAGSLDTGVPLSITAQMLARREIRTPGVLCPETSVPPEPFFKQLERRGIRVSVQGPTSKV
jgi:lysine 6-dehydrogenase